MKNKKTAEVLRKTALLLLLAALVVIELGFRFYAEELGITENIYMTLTRFIGALACMLFMLEFSYHTVMYPLGNKSVKALLLMLPAFVIAVNNFPFASYLSGDCTVNAAATDILLYAAYCLTVGFFEEMAFRGCAFMFFLKKRSDTRLGVFLAILFSSIIFGVVHLVNIFTSSPGAVILQIGYSALIGALCSVVLLYTKNIWLCVLCHGIYNFCGGLKDSFGAGVMWTTSQMIFTAVVAVIVTAYMVWLFFKMPISNAKELYSKPKEQ